MTETVSAEFLTRRINAIYEREFGTGLTHLSVSPMTDTVWRGMIEGGSFFRPSAQVKTWLNRQFNPEKWAEFDRRESRVRRLIWEIEQQGVRLRDELQQYLIPTWLAVAITSFGPLVTQLFQ